MYEYRYLILLSVFISLCLIYLFITWYMERKIRSGGGFEEDVRNRFWKLNFCIFSLEVDNLEGIITSINEDKANYIFNKILKAFLWVAGHDEKKISSLPYFCHTKGPKNGHTITFSSLITNRNLLEKEKLEDEKTAMLAKLAIAYLISVSFCDKHKKFMNENNWSEKTPSSYNLYNEDLDKILNENFKLKSKDSEEVKWEDKLGNRNISYRNWFGGHCEQNKVAIIMMERFNFDVSRIASGEFIPVYDGDTETNIMIKTEFEILTNEVILFKTCIECNDNNGGHFVYKPTLTFNISEVI